MSTSPPEHPTLWALLNRLDAEFTEALTLRDERNAVIRRYKQTNVTHDPSGELARVTTALELAMGRVFATRSALQALGAPSLPFDADFHGKTYTMAVAIRVLSQMRGLSKEVLAELNTRAL